MTTEDELTAIADAMSDLKDKFHDSRPFGLFLPSEHQATFKRLAVEAKVILDDALGRLNDFSINLIQTIKAGSGGYMGGPSCACVMETAEILRGAVNHMRRRPTGLDDSPLASTLKPPYVDPVRLAEISSTRSTKWDLSRLARLCGELNIAHEHDCYMTVAILVRSIVDHVPPIFACKSFAEVASNYGGSQSFKKSMETLQRSLRNIADSYLHTHVRDHESVPTAVQVNFSQDLDVLLAETVRLVKQTP